MGNVAERILLKNGNVLDVKDGAIKSNLDILIEGDIIKEVGKIDPGDESGVKQIDCSRKYILPGLFECHAHLTMLTNQPEEEKKAIRKECGIKHTAEGDDLEKQVLEEFVRKGITQVRDCGGPVNTLRAMRDKISQREYVGPDLFYAGPMLEKSPLRGAENNKRWPGFTVAVDSKQDAENIIEEISGEGASLVKTFGKFDEDVLKCLLEKAREQNLPVTHDPGPTFFHAVPVDKAINLGIRCIEHGKSPWYVTLKDDLKSEHDRLVSDDPQAKEAFVEKVFAMGADSISMPKLQQLTEKMIDNDVYICPTLRVFRHYAEQPEQFNDKELEKFRKRFEVLYEVARVITEEIAKGGIRILVGCDGWSPILTLEEMEELKDAGLSETEIIKGATIYPAHWLGITDEYGSISVGAKANILILRENPLKQIKNARTTCAVLKNGVAAFQD
jgi:imidazolonepropionase-like amidohydrolase